MTNAKIDGLSTKVDELKTSLEFTQREVSELKTSHAMDAVSSDRNYDKRIETIEKELSDLKEKAGYLENQSRRNNLRIDGIPESTGETWDDTERKVKETLVSQLDLTEEPMIERAHRVGRPKTPGMGRSIVCKIQDWKQKEAILQASRKVKPPGLYLNEDLATETVRRRKELVPELKSARQQGKLAYFVLDKLVVKDRPNPSYDSSKTTS